MGWLGFGKSQARDAHACADTFLTEIRADALYGRDRKPTYNAVCIDRIGKPSRLPDNRPRRERDR